MQIPNEIFEEILEGQTKILVPKKSLTDKVPPKEPVFFNPRARLSRDYSIIAYGAFLKNFKGPKIFLEGLSGLGVRGLRVANELQIEKVIINDLNPTALKLAEYSAQLNNLKNLEYSEMEVCRFLSKYSKKDERGAIVDIDPFGSPSEFFDCGIRATMHSGILSVTATDLQVLNGLYQNACKRKYGGIPVKVEYRNEMAIRLILGSLRMVAGRIGVEIVPIFAESNMHYYRVYVRILIRQDQKENIGYILHCKNCGHRKIVLEVNNECELCNSKISIAGPLWIDKIFEKEFVENMILKMSELTVDKICAKTLLKCLRESEMDGNYYTLDEIASKMKASPPKLEDAIKKLQDSGYLSSPTSFCPTGFKTNANINEIIKIFSNQPVNPKQT
ncbi:MAG: tRNA (guanine-N1)-methyltransferase [Nitrosarchaeum sp.]|nr:tRNA (guanine-N1)-methyltransferase [Nitrosarchaeum sp.]MBP0133754.1 tRNA (guanine-N1)-methyltransferase [Nitrosarchaeum sp.]MSV26671.1 tRNA (guanine-N1)-methyltransferase [Nitrosarchaeum sp.]PHY08306.1 MAG: tRNA (guanine-N1)-methyltransferase [Nitrosarchaeum sp.]